MKKQFTIYILLLLSTTLYSQRYVEEIFEEVEIIEDVVYGQNTTVLTFTGFPSKRALNCDIYQPKADDLKDRPLIVLVHDGIFIPPQFIGGCTGTRKDASIVEMAKRFSRMGYVTACIDYRLGWDPTNQQQESRKFSLINAVWRGVQDLNTAVKYFRKTVEEENNIYGIDPNKIATIGFGTGGVVTYSAATLDNAMDTWSEFVTPDGPMIVPSINGDIAANTIGIAPSQYLLFPPGDTVCHSNHIGYDHETQFSIQFSGALLDLEWMDEEDTPMMGFHVKEDLTYPCEDGTYIVFAPILLPVVDMHGACDVIPLADELGLNDVFNSYDFIDYFTIAANQNNGGIDGLYITNASNLEQVYPFNSAPWDYAYNDSPYNVDDSNCKTWNPEIQKIRDTCMNYIIPRVCVALDLGCDLVCFTNIDELDEETLGLMIAPNPAKNIIQISTENEAMTAVYLFDLQGKLIQVYSNILDYQFQLNRKNLPAGIYLSMIRFEEGFVTKKIVFE